MVPPMTEREKMELNWQQLKCGTRAAKVAGGTVLHVPAGTIEEGDGCGRSWVVDTYPGGVVFVPDPSVMAELGTFDPTAPHCQPTPVDAPPMTDEALREWCDAMLGQPEPISADRNGDRWKYDDTFVYCEIDEPADERWAVPWCDYGLPASIAGPALWAANKYGAP